MKFKKIFKIKNQTDFISCALEVFRFQSKNCKVYQTYLKYLNINPNEINEVEKVPFLPIGFFKSHFVSCGKKHEKVFLSSGTSSSQQSQHFVKDLSIYQESFQKGFELFYGNPNQYNILALLPSYLERNGSSLIYMVEKLILESGKLESGFYLNNFEKLKNQLINLEGKGEKNLLIGVSFGLLDFLEKYNLKLNNTIIMETGGMKGRRKEMIRKELHHVLKKGFGVNKIHSEYGMTELLSQAYSIGNEIFSCPPWMNIFIRDINDPFAINRTNKGAINVIDLANVNSCSFIATDDLGEKLNENNFKILGRMDNSILRGCNLMIT